MHIGLVVTKDMLMHENVDVNTRYMGFIIMQMGKETEKRLEFYEVLDAETASAHEPKERLKARFKNALELFYKKDFYLARNTFTDIMRHSPDDELAKWYLFECEHYLNETAPEDFTGALHMEEDNR